MAVGAGLEQAARAHGFAGPRVGCQRRVDAGSYARTGPYRYAGVHCRAATDGGGTTDVSAATGNGTGYRHAGAAAYRHRCAAAYLYSNAAAHRHPAAAAHPYPHAGRKDPGNPDGFLPRHGRPQLGQQHQLAD